MRNNQDKKEQILSFIQGFCAKNGYPPTIREIGQNVGLSSPASVHAYMERLISEGAIIRGANHRQAYSLAAPQGEQARAAYDVPLLGHVAAGLPIYAQESIEDWFPLPHIFPYAQVEGEDFMLRVRGDSMTGVGILDGDILIIHARHEACNREIVVARVDEESYTVKRYFKSGETVTLVAENPKYPPIKRPSSQVEIIGKVVGLMRTI